MSFDPSKIHQVSNYLFRGPRPPSFEWLHEAGFKRVINLQSGVFQFFHHDRYEEPVRPLLGITSLEYHWSDIFAPELWMLGDVAEIMRDALDEKVKTYIHCLHGKDRTGMACAAYRIIYQNWKHADAIVEMKALGFHTFPYWFWIKQLESLEKSGA